jgi:predicted nucleic acid-binding protein
MPWATLLLKFRTETKKRLMQIAGELKTARGVSLNEVIGHLIENYRTRSRKPLNLADLDHLAVELEEDASEKIDDILYRKVVINTSYFVAYLNKRDRHHAEALKLSKVLENYHPYITDHILDELVTYFSYRVDRRHAASVAEAILKKIDEGELDIVLADSEILTQALTYLKKYDRDLNFTDCITLATMDQLAA